MPTSALLYGLFSIALFAAPLNAAFTGRLGPPDHEGERILKALQTTSLRLLRISYRQSSIALLFLCGSSTLSSFLNETPLLPGFFAPLMGAVLVCLGAYWWLSRVFIAAAQEVSNQTTFDALSFRSRAAGLATLPVVGAYGLACLSTLSFSSSLEESTPLLLGLAGGGVTITILMNRGLLLIRGGLPREIPSHLADPTSLVRSAADLAFASLRSSVLLLVALALVFAMLPQITDGDSARDLSLLAAIGPLLAIIGSLMTGARQPLKERKAWFSSTLILVILAIVGAWQISKSSPASGIMIGSTCALGMSVLIHLFPLLSSSQRKVETGYLSSRPVLTLVPLCAVAIGYRVYCLLIASQYSEPLLAAALATAALVFLPWSFLGRTTQLLATLQPTLRTMRGDSVHDSVELGIGVHRTALSGLPLFLVSLTSLVAGARLTANSNEVLSSFITSTSIIAALIIAATCALSLRLFRQQAKLLETNSHTSLEYQKSVQLQGSHSPNLSAPISDSLKAQTEPSYLLIILLLLPVLTGNLLRAFDLHILSLTLSIASIAAGGILVFLSWFLNATPWRIRLSSQLLTLIGMHFILWIPMVTYHS